MQQPVGQTWNGGTDFKWGRQAPLPPSWRRPCIADLSVKCTGRRCKVGIFIRNHKAYYQVLLDSRFFKENVRYPVWTCRDTIFSDSRDPMITFFDSRYPILNSTDPNRVPKTPLKTAKLLTKFTRKHYVYKQ